MNLYLLTDLLRRRGWLFVLLAMAGMTTGLVIALAQTPVYEAETRVAVRPRRPADLGQTQAIKESMRSYMQDISTLDMAHAVDARLSADAQCGGYDVDPGRLLYEMLRVGSDENVYEIQVKARSTDPAEATCVSSAWAQEFVERREKINLQLDPLDRIVTEPRDETTLERIRPRRRLLVLAGAVAGLIAAGGLILVLEYFESAFVRSRDEAAFAGEAPVLGAVATAECADGGGSLVAVTKDIARDLRRALVASWPVFVLAILGGLAALVFSFVRPTEYRARTRIAVEPARSSDWGQTQAIREIMRGFSEDIATRRMAAEVNSRQQLDLPPEALLAKLSVAPNESIYEIYVDVRDRDEDASREVSRAWAQVFVEERERANLELDQPDRILTRLRDHTVAELWAPKIVPNLLAGLVLGALVGAAALLGLHLLGSGTLRTPEEAARAAGCAVLSAIPSAGTGQGGTGQGA